MDSIISIGVMSGSSLDGIDLAMVRFSKDDTLKWELIQSKCYAISDLKDRLQSSLNLSVRELAILESDYSTFLAECIIDFAADTRVDCCGIHGHTLLHMPSKKVSWQLQNGGMIAEMTGITTICDFRNQDMVLGGQGTPMAVIADRDLFPGYDYYINLGGIANISYQIDRKWTAYDLFPCNQVLNYYAGQLGKVYDEDGDFARSGTVHPPLLESLLSIDYLHQSPPKSIDNQWIKNQWISVMDSYDISPEDKMRTHCECMVEHLVKTIDRENSKVLITGGGAYNTFFIEQLKKNLPEGSVEIPPRQIIDYKEAVLMSYMAYLRLTEQTNFISSATGASRDVCGGAIYRKQG